MNAPAVLIAALLFATGSPPTAWSGAELKERYAAAKKLRRQNQAAEAFGLARQVLANGAKGALAKEVRIFLCETKAKLVEKKGLPPEETTYRVVPDRELTEVPEIIHQPDGSHSRRLRGNQYVGTLLMELIIDPDGCVAEAKVLKGVEPAADRAASLDAMAWVFTPAESLGKPVACTKSLKFTFDMNLDKRFRDFGAEPPPP